MLDLFLKISKRFYRLIRFRTKVYGKIGENNKFIPPVYTNEASIIGSNNYVGPYSMINNAEIGNYCSIAPSVKIGQGEHSLEYITTYQKISKQLINHDLNTTPSIIGNDVWLGANVVVKQNVRIGDGAVVGANAVVTKDIPPFAIAVGVPAKVIGYRFDEETRDLIVSSKWYEMDFDHAITKIQKLTKVKGR